MSRAIINWLYRTGIKRGSTGGNLSWFIVALAAWILRRESARVFAPPIQMEIKPGERLMVTARDPEAAADS